MYKRSRAEVKQGIGCTCIAACGITGPRFLFICDWVPDAPHLQEEYILQAYSLPGCRHEHEAAPMPILGFTGR